METRGTDLSHDARAIRSAPSEPADRTPGRGASGAPSRWRGAARAPGGPPARGGSACGRGRRCTRRWPRRSAGPGGRGRRSGSGSSPARCPRARQPRGLPAADGDLGVGAGLAVGDLGRLAQHRARRSRGDERPVDRDLEVAAVGPSKYSSSSRRTRSSRAGRLEDARRHRRRQPLEQRVVRLVVVGAASPGPRAVPAAQQRTQRRVDRGVGHVHQPLAGRPGRQAARRPPAAPASRPRAAGAERPLSSSPSPHLPQTTQPLERAPAGRLLGAPHHRTHLGVGQVAHVVQRRPPPAGAAAARERPPRAPGRRGRACRRGAGGSGSATGSGPPPRAPAPRRSPCVARWSAPSRAGCPRRAVAGRPAAP